MLINLLNVPKTKNELDIWSFSHKDSHVRIIQAIRRATGTITSVTLTNGGTGYTSLPGIQLDPQGSGATFNVSIVGGVITSLTLTNGGQGYITNQIIITGGGGTGATATITVAPGVSLTEYSLDPIPTNDFSSWLQWNQESHTEMNGVLGLQGSDLEEVDFKNLQQLQPWIWLHFLEHQSAEQTLGID